MSVVVGEEIAPVELREPEPSTRTPDNVMIILVKLAQFRPIRGLVDLVPNPTSPKLTFDGNLDQESSSICQLQDNLSKFRRVSVSRSELSECEANGWFRA